MADITRRTVLASVPAMAAVPAAAAAPQGACTIEPSDPALAARWRDLFPRIAHVHVAYNAREEEGGPIDREWEAAHEEFKTLWKDLASAPVRTLGDVLVRAIIARHNAYDGDEHFDLDLMSRYWSECGPAQLIRAALALAGLPAGEGWRQAIAEKMGGQRHV